jgi:signal transduction histidine kinase
VDLHVVPFFWQTTAFRVGAGLLVLGLLATGHRWRTRRHHRRAVELTRLVDERSREAERRKREAEEASQQKTEILGIVAHDLKNPLTTILGHLELMAMDGSGPSELLDPIHRAAEKMQLLLQDLMSTAALETGHIELQYEELDGRVLLAHVARDAAPGAGRKRQRIAVSGGHVRLEGDEMRLMQAIENLVSNAIKFSPPGSAIALEVDRDGEHARVRVRDQGPGLTEQDRVGLFQKFTRLSARPTAGEPSTGLGLSIVKRLVELHGGQVLAEPGEPGGGATFVIRIPARRPPAGSGPAP